MTVRLPSTDARRAAALRAELDRAGSAMVPGWGLAMASDSFGRAVLEIAARFAEETSSRLDRTAERDTLAFYDTLDIPPPAPQAATATLVFVTEEARTTATSAPLRVQVGATVNDQEVIFETTRALEVSPARIADLVAVDADTDHIERAPGRVLATERPPDPVGDRSLVTAASAGSTIVQVTPAIGLEPGDQLRIQGTAYRIASVSEDLVTLVDPLALAVPAGTPFQKIDALEAFALRDLQQHACYVGHASLLNLERPARIELVLSPSGLAARLAALDLRYSLWGTKDGEDDPAWQALELVGGSATTLTVRKRWEGSVDEVDVDGRKSRWLRIEHPQPITTVGVVDQADHVGLRVQSEPAPAPPNPIGSTTITNAFHNAVPLAVTGRFLPFGPTPARFDIFSFAAPEALSKRGARVDIDIRMADASLLALVAPTNAEPGALGTLAYGIGSNGLLQSVAVSTDGDLRWSVLTNPFASDGTSVALDGSAGLLALRIAGGLGLFVDVVVAQDASGQLWSGWHVVGLPLPATWTQVALDAPVALTDLALVPSLGSGSATPARLLRVDGGELRTIALGANQPAAAWATVANSALNGPDLARPAAMAPVQRAATQGGSSLVDTDVVLTSADGSAWFGWIDNTLRVTWTQLHGASARADVRPAATHDLDPSGQVQLWVAWADDTTGITGWLGDTDGSNGDLRDAGEPAFDVAAGSSLRVTPQPWAAPTAQPLTTAVASDSRRRSILVWFDEGSTTITALPGDVADWSSTDLLIVRPPVTVQQPDQPVLVLPADGERLVMAPLAQRASAAVTFTLHDSLAIRRVADASHFVELVGGQAPGVKALGPARILRDDDRVYEVVGGLRGAQSFRFVRRVDNAVQDVDGEARAGGQLRLALTDGATAVGHRLVIGTTTSVVTGIDETTEPGARIVALTPPLAGPAPGSTVRYTPVRVLAAGNVSPEDRKTLVNLTAAVDVGSRIRFDDGAPRLRRVELESLSADGVWWRVGGAWTTVPVAGTAAELGDSTLEAWSVRALERGYDNPELSWEFFDGDGWRRLEQGFVDGTQELATSGTVSFRVPPTLSATEIGGREDLWIRARLVGGDYGRPKYVVTTTSTQNPQTSVQSTTIDTSDLHPPEITSIEASFVLDAESAPESVLVFDNLATLDQTQASAADQARFALFSGARAIDPEVDGRALYVGLTRQPVSPLVLYAVVDDQDVSCTLAVDVLTAAGWRRATVDDETGALHRTGLIQVSLSTPLARAASFGREGFWLRLRPAPGATGGVDPGAWQPVVRGLFVNGAPAKQARTIVQEILGSSLGEPSLTLELAETPVLPETLELRVREQLSEDELKALEEERRRSILGSGRPPSEAPPVVGKVAGVDDTWVIWRRVDSFIGMDGDARVYRLDPATGRVTFGNGRKGKVPPAGNDAIRAFRYQQGGGRNGNAPAWSDLAVKSALQGIEAVVLPVDAAGGVDAPDPVTLVDTAPARLRHAGRALAVADYEALAVAAAPEVVRARCTRPERPGEPIRVVIALRDGTRRPVPSLALRAAVARTLRSAGWGGLPTRRLRVDPPTYVAVAVTVRLRVPAALAAQVEQAATVALVELLHPTEGGPDGRGWPFGRRLWESDVLRALDGVDGIDRVDDVKLDRVDGRPLDAMPAHGLVSAEAGDVDVQVEPVDEP
jgi:hypothetical protein